MMEKIIFSNQLFAIIVRKDFHQENVTFFTDGSELLELGYISYSAGHLITPHRHPLRQRKIHGTQEVLFVKSGKIRVDFYSEENVKTGSIIISKGDCIILLSGGHGFEFLEPSIMIEVKNGPYESDKDKIRFQPD